MKQPRIPMHPSALPQQRLYVVEDLPPRPEQFVTRCDYGVASTSEIQLPTKKPSSARHLCQLEWAWSPMNNRISSYYLSMNRSRSHWLLWMTSLDDNCWPWRWNDLLVAIGPKRGVLPHAAAAWLLHDMLAMEIEEGGSEYLRFWINSSDLLSVDDIQAIRRVLQQKLEGES